MDDSSLTHVHAVWQFEIDSALQTESQVSHDEPDKLGGLTICHHVIRLMSEKKKQQKFVQKHFLGWRDWLDVHRHDVIPQLLGVFELTVNVIQQYDS